jgi:hypothetical protein
VAAGENRVKALVLHDIKTASAAWPAGTILKVSALERIEDDLADPATHVCLTLTNGKRFVVDAGKIHLLLPGAVSNYTLELNFFGAEAVADHYLDGKLKLSQKLKFIRWHSRKKMGLLCLSQLQLALRELRSRE